MQVRLHRSAELKPPALNLDEAIVRPEHGADPLLSGGHVEQRKFGPQAASAVHRALCGSHRREARSHETTLWVHCPEDSLLWHRSSDSRQRADRPLELLKDFDDHTTNVREALS